MNTKLPLRYEHGVLWDADNEIVLPNNLTFPIDKDDVPVMAEIVLAVNSHAQLVEACRAAQKWFSDPIDESIHVRDLNVLLEAALDAAGATEQAGGQK